MGLTGFTCFGTIGLAQLSHSSTPMDLSKEVLLNNCQWKGFGKVLGNGVPTQSLLPEDTEGQAY